MRYRYGKLNADDYVFAFLPGGVMITASLFLLITGDDSDRLYVYICLLMGTGLIAAVLLPRLERYSISGNIIRTRKGLSRREIPLPEKMMLILSDADITSFQTSRVRVLHGRYAVTILHQMPLESVLARIHRNRLTRYSNVTIADSCSGQYVYSFAVDEKLLGEILAERSCPVIIPESLEQKFRSVFAEHSEISLHIDRGY